MTDKILNLFHRRVKASPVEERVFNRACSEVVRMHDTLALRHPAHMSRAWCEDCTAVVVLVGEACPCGSRSVVPHGARRAA